MDWSTEAQATLWSAAATFVTGLFAVVGAVVVGLRQADIQSRQVDITKRQTKILERQTMLAELSLRKSVFDERFAVYRATYDLLLEACVHGFGGKRVGQTPVEQAFMTGKDQAKFLFRPSVSLALQEIWSKLVRGSVLEIQIANADEGAEDLAALQAEYAEVDSWIKERLNDLTDLFGSELSLSDHDMRLG